MTENNSDNRAGNLKELTLLVSNGDKTLSEEVLLSEQKPDEYVKTHRAELGNRGIFKPENGLTWIALVDGLTKSGKLLELDWKESGDEIIKAILKLAENNEEIEQITERLNQIQTKDFSKTINLFERINQELEPFKLNLTMIDLQSDSFPLMLIRLADKQSVKELADQIEADRILVF